MFDFSKYFKRMSGKTDAKIELKDVPIKADSSASTDDGDMSLNEFVTRNIDYIVTGITLGDYSHYYDTDKYFEVATTTKMKASWCKPVPSSTRTTMRAKTGMLLG